MATVNNAIIGKTVPIDFLPTNRVTSYAIARGGPSLPSNKLGATSFYLDANDDKIIFDIYPKFEGELFYSNTVENSTGYNITRFNFRLFIAKNFPTPNLNVNLLWVPVVRTEVYKYVDPSTGQTWDPLGAYTCNPPYLCS